MTNISVNLDKLNEENGCSYFVRYFSGIVVKWTTGSSQ